MADRHRNFWKSMDESYCVGLGGRRCKSVVFWYVFIKNPFDNPNELRAGIMDSPSQYDMFVKSVNKKERWYDIPFFKLDGNYNCH